MTTSAPPAPPDTRSDEEREKAAVESKVAAERGHEPDEPDALGDLVVTGTGQLSFAVGGKEPTSSSLRITGGKFRVEQSAFSKGEKLVVTIQDASGKEISRSAAIVEEVAFKDEIDGKTGQTVGCERRHKARLVGLR